ncbi:MAG: nitroreductase family protein [Candidatus Thermoplasmatota archaeon]
MGLNELLKKRRAYRSLKKTKISKKTVVKLAEAARFSPSCFNNQPWRYVFVYNEEKLKQMHEALSKGNEWAKKASMIIAVFAKKEEDCMIYDREYYLFDTGLATSFLILKATELGFVAHPIAGYSPKKTREILGIPDEMTVISLIIVGKHKHQIDPLLSEKQRKAEKERPKRKKLDEFVFHNHYQS